MNDEATNLGASVITIGNLFRFEDAADFDA
jgi:hypothetical protein